MAREMRVSHTHLDRLDASASSLGDDSQQGRAEAEARRVCVLSDSFAIRSDRPRYHHSQLTTSSSSFSGYIICSLFMLYLYYVILCYISLTVSSLCLHYFYFLHDMMTECCIVLISHTLHESTRVEQGIVEVEGCFVAFVNY
jgi:hypothetical protein